MPAPVDVPVHLRSHWLTDALGAERIEPEPLVGEARADVCILGGGYTGMWTALRLKALEPSLDIVILEKDICGSGASGRNAGFLMSWASKFLTLQKVCGPQEGLRLLRASQDAIEEIVAFGKTPEVDAEVRQDGWIWAATSEVQLGAWDETLEALDKLGAQAFTHMSRDDIAARMTSRAYLAGVYEAQVATLQPAKLALGLRRAVLEAGVRVHENSPAIRIDRGRPVRVHAPGGTVRAEKLVFALNAWAAEHRAFRPNLVVVASDHHLSEPAPDLLDELGLRHGTSISDSRLLAQSMRTTPDGRVDFSKGGSHSTFAGRVSGRFDGGSHRRDAVHATFRANFPALAGLKLAADWRGPVTRTATGLPFFGRLPRHPNIVYGHGYSGNGVGPSHIGGRILASLALGREDEWSTCPLARGPLGGFPPEPFRFVGATIVRAAVARKESAEDAGRKPSVIDAALASLAPSGLVPKKGS